MAITDEVAAAVDEIARHWPDKKMIIRPDDQGGTYLIIEDVDLGSDFTPTSTWIGFQITFQYPYAK